MRKSVVLLAAAPLALSACNMNPFGPKGASATTDNSAAPATAVVPDAVIVNGVTYYKNGSPGSTGSTTTPAASSSDSAMSSPTAPSTPEAAPTDNPPPSSTDSDGVRVTGGH